ncbi:MAG: hypothetical protein K0Q55_3726 [Verrucomicrobia bacterium]|jgi:hypothetical protein|nr:hypothetical protein [Verrucomicrobiota bacterium]
MKRCLTFLTATLLAAGSLSAKEAKLVDVKIYPPDINLSTKRDRQSFLVHASYDNGTTRDVTAKAKISLGNAALGKIENFTVYPVADGETELKVSFEGQKLSVPVKVTKAQEERPISFALDVMPVFMKSGCNAGSCHGAARGKDGFRLSLFGYNADGDYDYLTREIIGRRINLAIPEDSLLLTKGAGQVQHTGGKLFEPESELYQTVLRWIQAGAPKDPKDIPTAISAEIFPTQAVLEGSNTTQRIVVRAKYSDGTDRDVTSLAAFSSNNDVAVKVTPQGQLTSAERGEAFVMARFETFTVGVQALVVPKGQDFKFPQIEAKNYIDELVYNKLKKIRVEPSAVVAENKFLRRVYLDIIGRLPTTQELKEFESDISTGKRERIIDELIAKPEFADMWVMKWGELLRVRSVPDNGEYFSEKNTMAYYTWLREQILSNVPVDDMVKAIVSANGSTFNNPPANYYKLETDVMKMSEDIAQVFMGMRIQCAQCHNHPFDRWTMNDYYGFASFFSQVGRKRGEDPRDTIVFNRGGGEINHPVTKRPVPPTFLGGGPADVKDKDRRAVLAEWIASPQNPYFARNLVNIVWAHFYGRGIIDPVDDVRISNPPSNPELLEELAKRFTASNYDFKALVRDITNSRTYQLATQANESNASDTVNFTKGSIRRMRAEILLDAINQVTESQERFNKTPKGMNAVQIADGNVTSYFLTTFGRATRETVCSCEVKMEPNLSQALHLLNGDTVNNKVQNGGVVKKLVAAGKQPNEIVEDLYLRTLARKPTSTELEKLEPFLVQKEKQEEALNDLFWSLLNSKEFMFNH